MNLRSTLHIVITVSLALGCQADKTEPHPDEATQADTDADADADTDTDADADTDTDTDTDAGCDERELDANGDWTGLVVCDDGSKNRESNEESCFNELELPQCSNKSKSRFDECLVDADCVGPGVGRCVTYDYYGIPVCGCRINCETDADCGDGFACICGGNRGTCRVAACTQDADCASGECGISEGSQFGGGVAVELGCRDPAVDECRTDDDCPPERFGPDPTCLLWRDGDFSCVVISGTP